MQATEGVNPESDTNRDVKVILVEDSVKEDSGIGSTSGVSADSSLNDEAGTSPRVCRITKNIIIEFQALNCKANGNRESTFVQNAGKIPATDLSSIKGSTNVTISSEGK